MLTSFSHTVLSKALIGYHPNVVTYLVNGIKHGFRLPQQECPVVRNLKSADEFPAVIDQTIQKELDLCRMLGTFDTPPAFPNFRDSLLGVVAKKTPGEFRTIHHLSYTEGSSVNDFIPQDISSVQYATIQDAITFLTQGHHIFMANVDIESTFRIIPIAPLDRPLLGFQWKGKFFMDAVLPMGCSSSCAIFETFN